MPGVNPKSVLETLKASKTPMRNVEIRRAILGVGNEACDPSEALQKLKADGLVLSPVP